MRSSTVLRRTRRSPRVAAIGLAVGPLLVGSTLLAGPASAMETSSDSQGAEVYLGINNSSIARLTRQLEQSLAQCMKKEGFEYTPETAAIPSDALDGGASNRKAFVEKYGYGISTLAQSASTSVKNANQAYIAKLSAADRHSYYQTLLGFDPEKNASAAPSNGFDPKSCVGKTTTAIFGNVLSVQALLTKYNDLEKRINADTSVVRAMRDWSGCMKKSGYTYAKDADVPTAFSKKLSALKTAPSGPAQLLGAPQVIDTPGLKKLQKEELATAKADWECSTKHLGARDKVAKQLRKDFFEQNKAALEPLKKIFGGK